jgi:hypothetical protein
MRTFQHHPDGLIYSESYMMSLADFRAHIDPTYRLPIGAKGRFYQRGIRHWLSYANGDEPQPLEWPLGDDYAILISEYFAAQQSQPENL